MPKHSMILVTIAAVCSSTCARRVPQPTAVAPGTPQVSWVIMSGDRDNPDQEFVCQSNPRTECIVPASRPDAQVFSDVHFYYRGAGADTKYTGSIEIGFFQGTSATNTVQVNISVKATESISNQSVTGIVSATPGRYAVTFALVATPTDTGRNEPIRVQVPVLVQ